MSFALSHLTGTELGWRLDLKFAGQDFHLSRDFEVYTSEGDEDTQYNPGLEWGGTLQDQIDLLSDSPSPNQAALTLHLSSLINVPEAVAAGHDLAAAVGKLWLWSRDSSERLLLIDGRVLDPQYGAEHEPVTLTIEEAPFDDDALFPPANAQISSATWAAAADGVENERYPWVFGFPGLGSAYGSPGLWVANNKLLIAGHAKTAGANVHVWNITDIETGGASGSLAVAVESDSLGRDVTTVNITTLSHTDSTDEYWIQWDSTGAGGAPDHDQGTIRGAGSVLRYMLEQSDVRWDRGRIAAILPALNQYKIDCAITAEPGRRFSPLSWVQEHLAPILPISARQGPHGLYYSLFRYDATAQEAVGDINVDRLDATRDGAVSYSSRDQISNEIRVSYAFNAKDNKPTSTFVLTGDDGTLDADTSAVSNVPCRVSRDRFGLRTLEVTTEVIYDPATAGRIASWLSYAFALPSRTIAYTCRQEFGYLEPGDVVTVTDTEINLSALVCLVDSVTWTEDGSVGLVLRAIDNPARETFTESEE